MKTLITNCPHNWVEQRATFSDQPIDFKNPPSFEELCKNGMALTRYCNICGLCQIYSASKNEWEKSGNIKIKKNEEV